jgi:hypothetical protein
MKLVATSTSATSNDHQHGHVKRQRRRIGPASRSCIPECSKECLQGVDK